MPPAKKAAPAAAPLAPVAEVGDHEAVGRYQAALIEGKTEAEAREIGWPGSDAFYRGILTPLPRIEDIHDQPNTMVTSEGEAFYPDGPEDAATFAREHGAVPLYPDRFPWPLGHIESPAPETHCPTPDVCFPYGRGTGWHGCIHGETSG